MSRSGSFSTDMMCSATTGSRSTLSHRLKPGDIPYVLSDVAISAVPDATPPVVDFAVFQ